MEQNIDLQILTKLEQQRYQYLLNEQYDDFEAICHPQLRYVHSTGKVDDFAGYVGKCQNGFYKYQRADIDIERIDIFDGVATIFAELKSEFFSGEDFKKLHLKIVSIWVKHNNDWKFFAYQPTAII